MSWDVSNSYYSGQGIVMLAKRDANGDPMGFTPIGNVSDLKISVSVSTIEHKESQTGQRAIDLRLTTETKSALSMTVENFIAQNLADALRGSNTKVTGATVTAEAIKCYLGKVVALKHINVSTLVVNDGATPLTLGTDYTVNAEAGSIKFSNTVTGVVDGDALTVDYTFATQVQVDALTNAASELYMRFEGLNTAEGNNPVVVEVFKFLTDPLKELSLISDTIQQFTLEGSVLADSTKTTGSKFFRVTKLN